MKKLFGTDGVRGKANEYPMTASFALELGMASASIMQELSPSAKKVVLIGRDPRLSSDFLASALASGCAACGLTVYNLGVTSTPSISYLTGRVNALFGAMVSASHNPYYDNGIKLFTPPGTKLPDEHEALIEQRLLSGKFLSPSSDRIGRIQNHEELIALYEEMLFAQITGSNHLKTLRAVIDCANGATHRLARIVFTRLFGEAVFINDLPDGININHECGSTRMDSLAKAVLAEQADIGFAFDGDGDRVLFCTHDGEIVDGDYIMAICARYLKRAGLLKNNLVVATVMSNLGMMQAMQLESINVSQVQVGDKYVYEEMVRSDALLGGEQSGHIIYRDMMHTGDGILTALLLLKIVDHLAEPLSEIKSFMKKFPQSIKNLRVSDLEKTRFRNDLPLQESIGALALNCNGASRLVVRPSGTEPLIRIMAESESKCMLDSLINNAEQLIRSHITVEEPLP
ncbi:MAG: phosphoglucosamine mutase [Candidatus Wallbacteria bacterium]|nr:phosphoglucosamine mutase [Candidatus Wallbacteria bacterium]